MLEMGPNGQVITSLSAKNEEHEDHRVRGTGKCTTTGDISYQKVDGIEGGEAINFKKRSK